VCHWRFLRKTGRMVMARIATGTSVIRAVEAVLAVWILRDAVKLYLDGKPDAGISNAILAILLVITVEGLLWLAPRVVQWAEGNWKISSDEVLGRIVQTVILAFMAVDAVAFLITGNGIGVSQGGCLLSLLILEAIIRGVIRPDPRPAQMAQARVRVFTQLPSAKVKERFSGISRGTLFS
jgi:hypothetical protein